MKKALCAGGLAVNAATAAIAATAVAAATAVFSATAAAAATAIAALTAVAAAIKCKLCERRWPENFKGGSINAQGILIIILSIIPRRILMIPLTDAHHVDNPPRMIIGMRMILPKI